jgi:uncharacterized membrane protein YvlD (DUF360 family)
MKNAPPDPHTVRVVQLGILVLFWAFVIGIISWIIGLIRISLQLRDIPSASIGISLVAIPVFLLLLGLFTYVFWGILFDTSEEKLSAPPEEEKRHES